MTQNDLVKPTISVDFKKYRLRIHKNTLHAIGDPEYILLLVNPEEHILAISCSDRTDPHSHRIAWASLVSKKSYELYSRLLVKSLRKVCTDWQDNQSYCMYGEIIPNKGVAQFNMDNSVLVNRVQS